MARNLRTTEPIWVYPKIDPSWTRRIVDALHLHPVTAQLLVSRGFANLDEIRDFIYSKLPDLHDPFIMTDMPAAVDRVCAAIERQEAILIYGDNDVDGMTGTALLTEFLRSIGASVIFYLPNRTELQGSMVDQAATAAREQSCRLLITVDCGITAADEIAQVVRGGIDVIVTDHHEPTAKIPLCVATLNPKLLNNPYPNRELTGVGVAFKLAHAITQQLVKQRRIGRDLVDLKNYLDLVALGTIADMGALLGENRILVRYGMRQLKKMQRTGLHKLMEVCDLTPAGLNANAVAAKIAPRLNSLGRIADPRKGVELLLIREPLAAEQLARELDLNNIERQKIEQLMSDDVDRLLEENPDILDNKAIVMSSEKWHPGIIAIVTTRISKQFNRPTLMIAIDRGMGKGSARTIREFPLLPVLKENADLLENFGGHDYAAGFSVKEENIPLLRQRFISRANQTLKDQDVISKLLIDAHANFDELTFDLMDSLGLLEPHGNENPAPIFYCDAKQVRPPRLVGSQHLRLYLRQEDRQLEVIGFGMASRRSQLFQKNHELSLRVAYTPQLSTFQGKLSIQLMLRDFKVL
jgi:single-stranded-DNA-specific exonuclease